MRITLIIASVLVLTAGGLLWLVLGPSDAAPSDSNVPTVRLPVGGLIPNTTDVTVGGYPTDGTPTETTVTINDAQGNPLIVRNFLVDETVRADKSNKGAYLLAGNLGSCVTDQTACQAGPKVPFNIFYDEKPQAFTLALAEEPLGDTRAQAEQSLQKQLGVTQADMCRLNYYVSTTEYVNSQFAGKNLGFSFCPGATVLP